MSDDLYTKFYASRVANMRSSEIRELLSILQQDVISFAGGAPDPNTFPKIENFQEAVEYALANYEKAFQYGTTEGLLSFRKQISAFMYRQMNVKIDPENILVTVGSQEALDIIGRVFLDYR
ncbi:TPA: aminotransferase class I/II-fold pyridoxal phosphate-dependent enzyme, partial [Candidatus Geothermarchaeota archaeon]|nr:aminotransferase class I/II-fold pyridoxal phosphate-dependent enzyme [Candidatus Geothermarchaeota archaeon]